MIEQIAGFGVEHVHGPAEVYCAEDELVVVCLVRDGLPWVASFVEHYFALGAEHLVFLDNGSTDGTVEALKGYEGVTVLRTGAPFREYEDHMRRYLAERFCQGRWSLCVDVDEMFDFPYSGVIGLRSFLRYLRSNSYTAVVAQMLDLFPESLSSGDRTAPGTPFRELHTLYDTSNISRESLQEHHRCPPGNTYASDEVRLLKGGIRKTVFGFNTILTKHPLVFLDGQAKPVSPGTHWAGDVRVADLTCVLYHYKFLRERLHEVAARTVRGQQHRKNLGPYRKYLAVLEENPDLLMRRETSREFSGVDDLLEDWFLVASEKYLRWVAAEEEKTLAQTLPPNAARDLVGPYLKAKRLERTRTRRAGLLARRLYQSERRGVRQTRQAQTPDKRSPGGRKRRGQGPVAWRPDALKRLGVRPRTVVDVGVGRGTPQLYAAFPDSFHALVEPLEEHEPGLRKILTKYKGAYFLTALGSEPGKAAMTVEPRSVHMSSMQERTALTSTGDRAEKREVPVTTLDSLAREHGLRPPFGLKIDTEGFELEVVRGAAGFLRETQFVIAEVSVAERFVGGYSFAEFAEVMTANGFFLWDILNPGGGRIVDAVFRPALGHQPTSLLVRQARSRARNIVRVAQGRLARRRG